MGFFACEPLASTGSEGNAAVASGTGGGNAVGVGLTVAPPYLESALRARMIAGHAAPYSREALLFGDEGAFEAAQRNTISVLTAAPRAAYSPSLDGVTQAGGPRGRVSVPRWLLVGVHPGIFPTGGNGVPAENWPEDVAAAGSFPEALSALLAGVDRAILGLRPPALVILLETGLLARYFKSLCAWKRTVSSDTSWEEFLRLDPARQEEGVGKAVLTWMAEEGLHPRVALVCRTPREQETLLLHLHWSLVNSPSCANVLFRL